MTNMSDFFPAANTEFDVVEHITITAIEDDGTELPLVEVDDLGLAEVVEICEDLHLDFDIDLTHEPMRRQRPRQNDWN